MLHACGFKADGRLGLGDASAQTFLGFGPGVFKPAAVKGLDGRRLVQLACGDHHSVALAAGPPEVFTWGNAEDGRLGLGHLLNAHEPRAVRELAGVRIVEVAAGSDHTLARSEAGHVWAWGLGSQGQLGLGDLESRTLPEQLRLPPPHGV